MYRSSPSTGAYLRTDKDGKRKDCMAEFPSGGAASGGASGGSKSSRRSPARFRDPRASRCTINCPICGRVRRRRPRVQMRRAAAGQSDRSWARPRRQARPAAIRQARPSRSWAPWSRCTGPVRRRACVCTRRRRRKRRWRRRRCGRLGGARLPFGRRLEDSPHLADVPRSQLGLHFVELALPRALALRPRRRVGHAHSLSLHGSPKRLA
mmetsp:Transcript_23886/g.75692  ORF Transcript_23886/g.75692 Transcript_23886/m.75692 type:complete len:209 (-) Transcript_23886:339-965(-)